VRPRAIAIAAVAVASIAAPIATLPGAADRGPPVEPSFEVVHYRLDNGLEVVLHPDPSVTTAVVHVWYHVGSKDERPGRTGFAHLLEHLMFEGSRHVGRGELDVLLEEAGGWNNGTTSNDRTNYFEQVPANYLELALWLEADRMAGLWDAMNQHVLDNQRDVVLNERRQSYENQPYGAAELELQQALWPPGHGNHNLTLGLVADIQAAMLDDVEVFWRTWYVPSNATLVVAGRIDVAATRTLVDRYFGWMAASPRPARRRLDAPVVPLPAPVVRELGDRVHAAKVMMAWRTDVPHSADAVRLAVAAQILGGGKTSRLYRRLVLADRTASEVYADVVDQLLGGELHVEALVAGDSPPEVVRAAMADEIAALRDAGPTDEEVERARRVLESSRLAGLENLASRAEALAQWAAYTGDPDHLAEELSQLRRVTAADVQAAVRTWVGAAVTMIVRPE
jgi:zinc protease